VRRVGIGVGRLAGIVWLAYFGLSTAGLSLKILPLSLAANAVYFVVAIVLFQFLASADRLGAFALLLFVALGSVIQSVGMIEGDTGIQRSALVFFGLFLAALGHLLLRAEIAPRPLGYALVAAGLASCTLVIPQVPAPVTAVALGFGGLAEGALVVWLLLAG
jgi:hypothetical protein